MTTPTTRFRDGDSNDQVHCQTPLITVSDLPPTAFPTVMIPDNRYSPLCEHGARRAMDSPGTIENHERGILGEYAFGMVFGIADQVDTTIYEFGDPGYDFELFGQTIDVKTAKPQCTQPSLMVSASKDIVADYYVLVHQLHQRSYRILGSASAAIVDNAPIRRIGTHSPNDVRVVSQDCLSPITSSIANMTQL